MRSIKEIEAELYAAETAARDAKYAAERLHCGDQSATRCGVCKHDHGHHKNDFEDPCQKCGLTQDHPYQTFGSYFIGDYGGRNHGNLPHLCGGCHKKLLEHIAAFVNNK